MTGPGGECAWSGEHADAVAHDRRGLAVDPGLAVAHNNLWLSLTALGEREEAWREAEWRYELPEAGRYYPRGKLGPRWDGGALGGSVGGGGGCVGVGVGGGVGVGVGGSGGLGVRVVRERSGRVGGFQDPDNRNQFISARTRGTGCAITWSRRRSRIALATM